MATQNAPVGNEFLTMVSALEDRCERKTDKEIPTLGKKLPECVKGLGTVLSLLDQMGSCWWGCRGGDHVIEYICGRVSSTGRAALRLARMGLYDEGLVLCRGAGEASNLLALFVHGESCLTDWKRSSRKDRLRNFSPAEVRKKLTALGGRPPIQQDRYQILSERASHISPDLLPNAHGIIRVPCAGGVFQWEGLALCVNELAVALAPATCFAACLLNLDHGVRRRIKAECLRLARQIGRIQATSIDQYREDMLSDEATRRDLQATMALIRRDQASWQRGRSGGPAL